MKPIGVVTALLVAAPLAGGPMTQSSRLQATTPSETEIVLTRTFAAPRETVFAALTRPEHLLRWMHSDGMTLETCDVDLRVGGKVRYVYRRSSGRTIEVRGVYDAVEAPRRFSYTESYDFSPLQVHVTTTLDEAAANAMLRQTLRYATKAERDGDFDPVVTSSEQAYTRLDRYLAGRPASTPKATEQEGRDPR